MRQRPVAAVEIVHAPVGHRGRADGDPRRSAVELVDVDQVGERLRQRQRRIVGGILAADRGVRAEERPGFGSKKPSRPPIMVAIVPPNAAMPGIMLIVSASMP